MADRVLLGKRLDNTYGLDISLPSFDVKTCDPFNMAFSTRWGAAGLIHQTGLVGSSIGQTVNFPTLSYIPLVYCIIQDNTKGRAWKVVNNGSNVLHLYPWGEVTTSTLYFSDAHKGSADNFTCRYVIFTIPGN